MIEFENPNTFMMKCLIKLGKGERLSNKELKKLEDMIASEQARLSYAWR